MAPRPAAPLSPRERDALRARHLADQAVAAQRDQACLRARPGAQRSVAVVAWLLVLAFLLGGSYSVAAALGVVPAVAGSALAGGR